MQTRKTFKFSVLVIGFIFIIILPLILAIVTIFLPSINFVIYCLAGAAGILIALAVIINLIALAVMRKKEIHFNSFRNKLFAKKEELLKNYKGYTAKTKRLTFFCRLYLYIFPLCMFFINAALFTLTFLYMRNIRVAGFLPWLFLSFGALVFSVYFEFFTLSRYAIVSGLPLGPHIELLRSDFPQIWSTAERAMAKIGINSRLYIVTEPGCNMRIIEGKDGMLLAIGNEIFRLLSREEIYTVCLHEFGHAKLKHTHNSHKSAEFLKRWELISQRHKLFPAFLFLPLGTLLDRNLFMYSLLTSYRLELEADRLVTDKEDVNNFVSALAKLELWALDSFELPKHNVFASETFPNDFYYMKKRMFLANYSARKKKWDDICVSQLPARIDTHPNLSERMKNLGVSEFNVDFTDKDEGLNEEIKKIEDIILPVLSKEWPEGRKYNYVMPKETIKKALEDAALTPPISAGVLARAYVDTCDYEKALQCFNKVLDETPAHQDANYYIGLLKCDLYDNTGIEYLKKALNHPNYCKQAYARLGMYLQYMGLKKERDGLRELMYEKLDENINAAASKKYSFSAPDVSGKQRAELAGFLKSLSVIKYAYLVKRKTKKTDRNALFFCFSKTGDEHMGYTVEEILVYLSDYGIDAELFIFDTADLGARFFKKLNKTAFRIV